jgi:hypothetical protein
MSDQIIEWAPFKLKEGTTESDLIAASNRFQETFLGKQKGFVRRELLRKTSGEYVDLVYWKTSDDAGRAMASAEGSEATATYLSVMDANGGDAGDGVLHLQTLRPY